MKAVMFKRRGARRSILVVDDDPTFCILMQELLGRFGFAVTRALSAQEALDHLETQVPDLILTDIMMPGIDGLTLLRQLRSEPTWSRIPAIVVSARVLESEQDAARRAGADEFIGKPFSATHLLSTVQAYLGAN